MKDSQLETPEQILVQFLNEAEADMHSSNFKDGRLITKSHTKALAALDAYYKALRRADMEAVIEGDYDEERKRIMEERLNG